ncbi:(5-formylfuran-3-yl)methyl phosphate synthase [Planctomicrobium piriforme]|uniref:(5-formylfuran-3-yl)methyl phosphate synthase n=1 Tax=Planctomicrobium piriforme TaxID=1576369 RepID=A0A1I3HXA8_9PLAN|nr:(5-formylfuran-3-yl)methyl phosphate synthase [Planctomicrobium piriforme]SFI40239.1 hypothetical protein SAMN05421753_108225 [Planctomicrobium piriforme]
MPHPPRLLVSVRNAEEAGIAAAAGADLIDFKEPLQGSLGMVEPATLRESVACLRQQFPECVISAACGEVLDWDGIAAGVLPAVQYLKLGLAGLASHSDWKVRWTKVRRTLSAGVEGSESPSWIAVAYVDNELAQSPPVEEVIAAAFETGCVGMLFDTCSKGEGRLLDYLSEERLISLTAEIQQLGLLVAAAGRLSIDDVSRVCQTGVDIIAIRSAACLDGDRGGSISSEAIERFRTAMECLVER